MSLLTNQAFKVWAQLFLCENDCNRIFDFFNNEVGINTDFIVRNLHLTVYQTSRPLPGVTSLYETVNLILEAKDTRFMVMAPGGENPREQLDPGKQKVGIRVHKQSSALPEIFSLRERMIKFETPSILGERAPSTNKTNAFGAKHYQPHITLLKAGSDIQRNLKEIGVLFRENFGTLTFNRFVIDVSQDLRGQENKKMHK